MACVDVISAVLVRLPRDPHNAIPSRGNRRIIVLAAVRFRDALSRGCSLHQDIAKLMAQGFTDEAVARKLGMSVRTCRRHIAALMGSIDAVSRFQAGVRAANTTLIETT